MNTSPHIGVPKTSSRHDTHELLATSPHLDHCYSSKIAEHLGLGESLKNVQPVGSAH